MVPRPDRDGHTPFAVRAPSPRSVSFPILSLSAGGWRDLIILSSRLYGCEVYWDGERTQPVTKVQRSDYEAYNRLVGVRWQGWLAVRSYHKNETFLATVTPVTVADVPQLDEPKFDLRGWCIGLKREGGNKRTKLRGRWNSLRANVEKIGQAPDILAILQRMWFAPLRSRSTPAPDRARRESVELEKFVRQAIDSYTIPT